MNLWFSLRKVWPASKSVRNTLKWLHVTGGVPSYSFAVSEGDLPPGIEVTPLGTVDGVPSQAGSYKFSVQATDSAKNVGEQTFIVEVATQPDPNGPKYWPLAWGDETSALSMAVGVRYEFDLQAAATGGTRPYKFDLKEGSLPDGVDLTPAGYVVGTPTEAGHTRVVFGLYDADGGNVYQGFDCLVQGK